jgi:hypothetical protein
MELLGVVLLPGLRQRWPQAVAPQVMQRDPFSANPRSPSAARPPAPSPRAAIPRSRHAPRGCGPAGFRPGPYARIGQFQTGPTTFMSLVPDLLRKAGSPAARAHCGDERPHERIVLFRAEGLLLAAEAERADPVRAHEQLLERVRRDARAAGGSPSASPSRAYRRRPRRCGARRAAPAPTSCRGPCSAPRQLLHPAPVAESQLRRARCGPAVCDIMRWNSTSASRRPL